MKLLRVFLEALAQQDAQGLDDYLEMPNQNFTVSVDRDNKKLIFAPQSHASLPSKLRTFLTMLKRDFRVIRIKSLEDEGDMGPNDTDDPNLRGSFEIQFDPREDFEAIIDYIKLKVKEENM